VNLIVHNILEAVGIFPFAFLGHRVDMLIIIIMQKYVKKKKRNREYANI